MAPWNAYEFAFHILGVRADLVILSTAWQVLDERTAFLSKPELPDMGTISYWVRRLEPVVSAGRSEETIVVFANRCGVEEEVTYAGSSTVLGIKDGVVSVYGCLGRGTEELLIVDTDKPPFGTFVKSGEEEPADEEPGVPVPVPDPGPRGGAIQ
jgi:protein N-terminal amidase